MSAKNVPLECTSNSQVFTQGAVELILVLIGLRKRENIVGGTLRMMLPQQCFLICAGKKHLLRQQNVSEKVEKYILLLERSKTKTKKTKKNKTKKKQTNKQKNNVSTTIGVLHDMIMDYTGRLHPKGVPFPG